MSTVNITEENKKKVQMQIGRTKKMLEAGLTVSEICRVLDLSESTVRSYKNVIDQAKANAKK